jgi:hypothetical protein
VAEATTADEIMGLVDEYARKHHLTCYPKDGALREVERVSEAQRGTARAALETAVRALCDRLAEAERERDALRAAAEDVVGYFVLGPDCRVPPDYYVDEPQYVVSTGEGEAVEAMKRLAALAAPPPPADGKG